MINEILNIRSSRKDLRNFGLLMGIVFALLYGLGFYYYDKSLVTLLYISAFFVCSAIFIPVVLLPPHKAWMAMSIVLGWIMTRLILALLYYLILSPIAMAMKLSGKKFLDTAINKQRPSYWESRNNNTKDKSDYLRQF